MKRYIYNNNKKRKEKQIVGTIAPNHVLFLYQLITRQAIKDGNR